MMNETIRQTRSNPADFCVREDSGEFFIEGYFAVFNSNYEIYPGVTESVAPGAFSGTLGNDIRALINHDTRLVLGRNKAGTLELKEDSHGLWGRVKINQNDTDAINLYERVKRHDVDQCSFGFNPIKEDYEIKDDGSVHWTIREVDLFEVSVCAFPAYEDTAVNARKKDSEDIKQRQHEIWAASMKRKMKGE